jgi:chromosome segregation ATPase
MCCYGTWLKAFWHAKKDPNFINSNIHVLFTSRFYRDPVLGMAEKKGTTTTLEGARSILQKAGDTKQSAEDTIEGGVRKITSPIDQRQSQLESILSKVDEPFEVMEDKQMQATMAVHASQEKADATRKLLDAKELAHQKGADQTNEVMRGARSRAERTKSSVEDRQQNFQKVNELVRSLKEKIESLDKPVSASTPGGEI